MARQDMQNTYLYYCNTPAGLPLFTGCYALAFALHSEATKACNPYAMPLQQNDTSAPRACIFMQRAAVYFIPPCVLTPTTPPSKQAGQLSLLPQLRLDFRNLGSQCSLTFLGTRLSTPMQAVTLAGCPPLN